jgi:hypothetical protein
MPSLNEIIAELQFLSDRLSVQARAVAFGLLGVTWAILIGESVFLRKLSEQLGQRLLTVGALCLGSLLLDSMQYVIAYWHVNRTRASAESQSLTQIEYPRNGLRALRTILFWTKQVVILVAVVLFLIVIVRYISSAN